MSNQFPYYTEPTHRVGSGDTLTATNYARSTATAVTEERLIVDAADKISLLEPAQHPLTALLTNVGKTYDGKSWKGQSITKKVTGSPEFKVFEDYYGGRYAKVGAAYNTSDPVTITVTGAGSSSATIFTVGDVIRNARTKENMLVTTVGTTTIAVSRSVGTVAATAGVTGDGLFIVGNASEQGSGIRNVNSTLSTPATNYCQIFKTAMAVTNTEKSAKLYGGPDLPYQRAKKGTEHMLDIERAFWFGQKDSTTGATLGMPLYYTGGVLEFLENGNGYIQNQGGPLSAPDMEVFLREGFTYGSNTKVLFAGGQVISAINEIARGQIQTRPMETSYGMKISQWVSTFGTINLIHNPLFVEDYAGYGFLIDLECFKYRYMEGRDTKLHTNIQNPGHDGQVDQYLTECGLERNQSARHALIKNVIA